MADPGDLDQIDMDDLDSVIEAWNEQDFQEAAGAVSAVTPTTRELGATLRDEESNGSESEGEQGEGNTNPPPAPPSRVPQPTQRKYWCFTWFNEEDDETVHALRAKTIEMEAALKAAGHSYVFQTEVCPDTGRLHLQGYVEGAKRFRWSELGLSNRIHWGARRLSREVNIRYCSNPDKRMPDGWMVAHGIHVPKPIDVIEPNRPWQKRILEDIKEEPDDRKIMWYWSQEGGVGKTAFTKYLCVKHGACLLGGKGADVRNGIVKWKELKFDTPTLCVYNITRSFDPSYVSYEALENIKDMCFYSGKYEGAQVVGNPPHLYVFANFPPPQGKLSDDRLQVMEIVGHEAHEGQCAEPVQLNQ